MKKAAPKEKNSLKTIVIFAFCVFVLILVSLIVKTVLMIRVSKFDGVHRLTVAVEKHGQVLEVVSFDPVTTSTSVLQVSNPGRLADSDLGKVLGILPDEVVDLPWDAVAQDLQDSAGMNTILKHFAEVKTQLTLYDMVRLLLLANSATLANRRVESVTLPVDETAADKVVSGLFSDTTISSENVSIQVINASGVAGLGNNLARILTNMGGNVISVISAQTMQDHSSISYFGKKTYTLEKFSQVLQYPVSLLENETMADVVITIGGDYRNRSNF